ncbi:MAG: hypothetical protein M1823_008357, partial [Watsoniomyces obsoletus]
MCKESTRVNGRYDPTENPSKINGYTDIPQLKRWRSDIASVIPCTPLQEGMISKVASDGLDDSTYFAQFHYELKDHVDPNKLRECWKLIQQTTSILRTCFVSTADGFAQVVLKYTILAPGVQEEN